MPIVVGIILGVCLGRFSFWVFSVLWFAIVEPINDWEISYDLFKWNPYKWLLLYIFHISNYEGWGNKLLLITKIHFRIDFDRCLSINQVEPFIDQWETSLKASIWKRPSSWLKLILLFHSSPRVLRLGSQGSSHQPSNETIISSISQDTPKKSQVHADRPPEYEKALLDH